MSKQLHPIAFAIALCFALQLGRAEVTPRSVLDSSDRALGAFSAWSMEVTVTTTVRASKPVPGESRERCTYVRNGDKRDISSELIELTVPAKGGLKPVGSTHRSIINGYMISYDARPGQAPKYALFAPNGKQFLQLALQSAMPFECALEGRLHDPVPVTEIMRGSSDLRRVDQTGKVDGTDCVGIESTSKYGHHMLWCDPAIGYLPRKIVVVKKGGDLYGKSSVSDTRLRSPDGLLDTPSSITYTADAFQFKTFPNGVLPVSCVVTERIEFADGAWFEPKYEIQRSRITLNPDLGSSDLFKPSLPEGTLLPNQANSRIPYEWRNGRPVPRVSEERQ